MEHKVCRYLSKALLSLRLSLRCGRKERERERDEQHETKIKDKCGHKQIPNYVEIITMCEQNTSQNLTSVSSSLKPSAINSDVIRHSEATSRPFIENKIASYNSISQSSPNNGTGTCPWLSVAVHSQYYASV